MSERSIGREDLTSLAAEILERGHTFRFRARGVSMEPVIYDGDVLEVKSLDDERPNLGDIVLVRSNKGNVFAHRIVQTSQKPKSRFLLKGDALMRTDGWMGNHQILGRVIVIERGNKRVEPKGALHRWMCMIQMYLTKCRCMIN